MKKIQSISTAALVSLTFATAAVAQLTMPKLPSLPSVPSVPSVPSLPSVPSAPSLPAVPSVPSAPTLPTLPTAVTDLLPSAVPVPVIAEGKGTVNAYSWMVGCWQATSARDGSIITETWLAPRGGNLLGIGQTVREGKTVAWEAMRLYDEGGGVKLWLRPGLRTELTFTLDGAGENFASFVAKEADGTTKLRYERKSPTEMVATFRLEQGENKRGADFAFNKVECTGFFAANAKDPAAK
jgi:hypothetical protein